MDEKLKMAAALREQAEIVCNQGKFLRERSDLLCQRTRQLRGRQRQLIQHMHELRNHRPWRAADAKQYSAPVEPETTGEG